MSAIILVFFSVFLQASFNAGGDQKPDLLIIGSDTLLLSTYPLEDLQFEKRPFKYGVYYFPHSGCWRGYQAVWKVIDKKLFLSEVVKVDRSREKIDLMKYFSDNNYKPTIINGMIFADWFTSDLTSYKKDYPRFDCNFKGFRKKRYKPALRFENGVMTFSRIRSRI
jgi:hypothetical protein